MNDSKLYEVLSVKLGQTKTKIKFRIKSNVFSKHRPFTVDIQMLHKDTVNVTLSEKEIRKQKTLVKESEVIRIIQHLHKAPTASGGYTFLSDMLIVDANASTKYLKTHGILKVFGARFKRLLSSSGNIRNNKIIFVREELFDKVNEILLCGMPKDMEHIAFSKFNAYYALANTDSTVVTMPKIVVVKDFTKDIEEIFDVVSEKVVKGKERVIRKTGEVKRGEDRTEYSVETKKHTERIKPFDGGGLVDIRLAAKWAEENLKLNYIPSAFQFRAIPGLKGNLYTFDVVEFAEEHKKTSIIDAWGVERNLLNVDGSVAIDCILTVSQFKFYNSYTELYGKENAFNEWLKAYNTVTHGYKRTFNISRYSVDNKKLKDRALLSYQPLQSLNLNKDQIEVLCKDTVETIKDISNNVDKFLAFRGLLNDEDDSAIVPEYYRALKVNKHLFNDPFIQEKVKEDINGFKERTLKGAVSVLGNYQTLICDIVGLAEYAFGLPVEGCLRENQVYSKYWLDREQKQISIIRFPHVAMEHNVSDVVDTGCDYLKYMNEGIVTSMYDTLALKLNSADYDGDHILTTSSKVLIDEINKNKSNTITFVEDQSKDDIEKVPHEINDMDEIIATDVRGMGNNIGRVINQISKLWSLEQTREVQNYIKIMSVIGSLTIDFVKTGIKAKIPTEISTYLTHNGIRKPIFMKVIDKKSALKEKKVNKINRILGENEIELFSDVDCTMNRIYHHMRTKMKGIKFVASTDPIDVAKMMEDINRNRNNATYPKVLELLKSLKSEGDSIATTNVYDANGDCNKELKVEQSYSYKIFYSYCMTELLKICKDKNILLDYLVYAFYLDKNFGLHNPDKSILWNLFGKELNKRLKGKETEFKEVDVEKFNTKATKLNGKMGQIRRSNKEAYIKIFEVEKPDEPKAVTFYASELEAIKDKVKGSGEIDLAIALLIIDKFCKIYGEDFIIYDSKRNAINKNQIIKISGINDRNYEEFMKNLLSSKFIDLKKIRVTSPELKCELESVIPLGKEKTITNYNALKEIKKLVKWK